MDTPLADISTRSTPQGQPVPGRTDQVRNNQGGYVFTVDDIARLRRFLVLGVDGGTFYASPKALAADNAEVVLRLSAGGDQRLVSTILDVSLSGAAPRQTATLFALAVACASPDEALRRAALDAVPRVCRTFTMLATFLNFVRQFRGSGRGLRTAVGRFYTDHTPEQIAHQMVKYRNREGWTHRDVLRVAHPATPTDGHRMLYDWACGRETGGVPQPGIVDAYDVAQRDDRTPAQVAEIVSTAGLPWEAVPQEMLNEPAVLEALLPSMGATALLRHLPRLTRAGLLGPLGGVTTTGVVDRLTDRDFLGKGRIHPIQVLIAQRTYASGHSLKGSSEWVPSPLVVDALETTFDLAFASVEPSGKRTLNAVDVSASMTWAENRCAEGALQAREAAAAMALAITRTEPLTHNVAFSAGRDLTPLLFTGRSSLRDVVGAMGSRRAGGTDCSLPMLWALQNRVEVDTFVVFTDNETRHGDIHPYQALRRYREQSGIDARLVVCAFSATGFTIADPADAGMLDVVGLDPATPKVVADFSAGRI